MRSWAFKIRLAALGAGALAGEETRSIRIRTGLSMSPSAGKSFEPAGPETDSDPASPIPTGLKVIIGKDRVAISALAYSELVRYLRTNSRQFRDSLVPKRQGNGAVLLRIPKFHGNSPQLASVGKQTIANITGQGRQGITCIINAYANADPPLFKDRLIQNTHKMGDSSAIYVSFEDILIPKDLLAEIEPERVFSTLTTIAEKYENSGIQAVKHFLKFWGEGGAKDFSLADPDLYKNGAFIIGMLDIGGADLVPDVLEAVIDNVDEALKDDVGFMTKLADKIEPSAVMSVLTQAGLKPRDDVGFMTKLAEKVKPKDVPGFLSLAYTAAQARATSPGGLEVPENDVGLMTKLLEKALPQHAMNVVTEARKPHNDLGFMMIAVEKIGLSFDLFLVASMAGVVPRNDLDFMTKLLQKVEPRHAQEVYDKAGDALLNDPCLERILNGKLKQLNNNQQ